MTGPHEVALLRLVAQRVVGERCESPAQAVAWLTAVQAQDLPGALTSIALRTTGRSRAETVAAFDAGAVVRTWPMRGTLHAVAAEDAGWMVELMSPRPRTAAAKRRSSLGLDDTHLSRAHELTVAALTDGVPSGTARPDGAPVGEALPRGRGLTRTELVTLWEDHGLPTDGGRGYHLLGHLAQTGLVGLGPIRGKEQLVVLVDTWVERPRRPERDEALGELALRYLRSHGPATVKDLIRWSGLPAGDVREGVAVARPALTEIDVEGVVHLLDPRTPELLDEHREAAEDVLLLPGFDEIVLGYADRTATVPAEHADRIVPGANGVFRPTVLHHGVAVGTWRAVGSGTARRAEADAFTDLHPDVTAALHARFAELP